MREPHIIYGYRCKVGSMAGKWKIGCTLQNQKRKNARHSQHLKAKSGCQMFDNYLSKRLSEGYDFDEVFEYFQLRVFVCTRREAEQWEIIYTNRYNAMKPHGFNLRKGNYSGTMTKEHRQKIAKANSGWNNHSWGRKPTEETRRKISNANKGKIKTPEHLAKISKALTGKHHPNRGKKKPTRTEEHRINLSKSLKGKWSWMKGKKHTEETKRKISMTHTLRRWKNDPELCKTNFELFLSKPDSL